MKVLLPVDGSKCAQKTIEWAKGFLNKENAEIYLLNVIEMLPEIPTGAYEIERAVNVLTDAKAAFTQAGFTVKSSDYLIERPAPAIVNYANETGIDQIIMGSHGYNGLAKLLMGSVSESVFKMAKQPVLIIKNSDNPSLELSHMDHVKMVETSPHSNNS